MYGFPRRAATGGTMCRSSAGWRPSKPAETRSFLGLAISDSPTFAGLTTTGAATIGAEIKIASGSYLAFGTSAALLGDADTTSIRGRVTNGLHLCASDGTVLGTLTNSGVMTFNNTTASTSTTTGAVVVGGGVGVAGAGYFGGVVVVGSAASDPSGSNGMIYYDTANNRLRAYVNGAWATVQVA